MDCLRPFLAISKGIFTQAAEDSQYVPLAGVITEGLAFIAVSIVVALLYIRYFRRKKIAGLSLAAAFTFWNIGVIFLFVGKLTYYIIQTQHGGVYPTDLPHFSDLGIVFGYGFSAISNVFMVLFVSQVFSQSDLFRKTKSFIPLLMGVLNGMTVGMIIHTLIDNYQDSQWSESSYPIAPTIFHLILTFFTFLLLIYFASKALQRSLLRWEKAGFIFIIFSGVMGFSMYLSFVVDVAILTFTPRSGFTPFYYLAYVLGILMCVLAYFGYIMPNWVRNYFSKSEPTEL
jgi:hypothetical protein